MAENVLQRDASHYELSGTISVDSVARYRKILLEMISSSDADEIEVELGKIKMQGSAVIALLISILRESRYLNKRVVFLNCSEELRAIASACGVAGILQLN